MMAYVALRDGPVPLPEKPPRKRAGARKNAGGDGFAGALFLSLLLHLALVSAFWWVTHNVPAPPARELLVVELFGMLSDRQAEDSQAGKQAEVVPEAPRKAAPAPRTPRRASRPPPRRSQPVRRTTAPSPVQVKDETPDENKDDAPPSAPEPPGNAPEQDVRQTIRHEEVDLDAQRRYIAKLRRAVKAKLFYPPEAKASQASGMPVIAFRLEADGDIAPGSLIVRASSGNAILDEQALRAVRTAAPFGPPPRPMNIALEIPFTVRRF
ncbi:MAG: TonB family protein [Azoarcus sp.]|jgi:protein TonB|nr:TonB family protein [Azoarcus sp.]